MVMDGWPPFPRSNLCSFSWGFLVLLLVLMNGMKKNIHMDESYLQKPRSFFLDPQTTSPPRSFLFQRQLQTTVNS